MLGKLKKRWNIESNFQAIIILTVFAITGSTTVYLKKLIFDFAGITAETHLWIKIPFYILVILTVYNVLLLVVGFLFGQFKFFWEFEKKFFSRFRLKKKVKTSTAILLLLINSTGAMAKNDIEKATLGGGCFWCTEAVYLQLKGVEKVEPGYSGGHVKNPSYREVCNGTTGHAEVVQISFNPEIISFSEILEVFFMTHDPTTLNRQGNDVGTQYRSAIFYHSDKQKEIAEKVIELFEKEKVYDDPIVTKVEPFKTFYVAEDYHHNYYERNKNQPYCQFVITPKLEKFEKVFKDKLIK